MNERDPNNIDRKMVFNISTYKRVINCIRLRKKVDKETEMANDNGQNGSKMAKNNGPNGSEMGPIARLTYLRSIKCDRAEQL